MKEGIKISLVAVNMILLSYKIVFSCRLYSSLLGIRKVMIIIAGTKSKFYFLVDNIVYGICLGKRMDW